MPEKNIHEDSVNKDARNIPLSERMRSNVYADSPEKLEEDLIDTDRADTGGMQVQSDGSRNQEWDAREDVQDADAKNHNPKDTH